jgi:hypothetical protein
MPDDLHRTPLVGPGDTPSGPYEPTSGRYAWVGRDADGPPETGLAGAPPDPPRPAVSLCGTCAGGRNVRAGGDRRPRPPAHVQGPYDLVSQKTLAISSIESRSFWPCPGSSDFFDSPASLVAFQNRSWMFGCFSVCSGLK